MLTKILTISFPRVGYENRRSRPVHRANISARGFVKQDSPSIQPGRASLKTPPSNGTAVATLASPVSAEPMHWLDMCIMSEGKTPKPLPIVANALIALRKDPAVRGVFAFDQMQCIPMLIHD